MKTLDVNINTNNLNNDGKYLFETALNQSDFYNAIYKPDSEGNVSLTLWASGDLDDELRIKVRSKISYYDRMRIYGVQALDISQMETDESGELTYRKGVGGEFIPSEKHISNLKRVYGDFFDTPETRYWHIPYQIIQKLKRNQITGCQALNEAGAELKQYLTDGKFELWQNDLIEIGANISAYKQTDIPKVWKSARLELNYTMLQLATELDVSEAYISYIESGKKQPSQELILKFFDLYKKARFN